MPRKTSVWLLLAALLAGCTEDHGPRMTADGRTDGPPWLDAGAADGRTTDAPADGGTRRLEILRDRWGVPHIYGDSAEAALYGFGWAQAADHIRAMSDLYLEANGLLAQTFVDDDPHTEAMETREQLVQVDHTFRLLRVLADVEAGWSTLDAEDDPGWPFSTRSLLSAFAAGVNDWVAAHRGELPAWIPTFSPQGVLALSRARSLLQQMWLALPKLASAEIRPRLPVLTRGPDDAPGASNQFALGPSRTADGSVIVLASPHLPFHGRTMFYEAHLVGGGLEVAGGAMYGSPSINLGHTRRLAWSATNNAADNADAFLLTVDGADPTHHLVDELRLPFIFERETVTLADGSQHTFTLAYADLGGFRCPVVDPLNTSDFAGRQRVAAICLTMSGDIQGFTQALKIGTARDIEEARAAMRGLHMMKWNLVAGDVDGHIFYVCNSRHPRRPSVVRQDRGWTRPIDGSQAENHWQGLLDFDELPQAKDPAAGLLQNCNDPPGAITPTPDVPIDISGYPPDLCNHGQRPGTRGQRMLALLGASNDHTLDSLQAIASDTHLLSAQWYVPALGAAAEAFADDPRLADPAAAQRGIAVLDAWNLRADAAARGALLYTAWAWRVRSSVAILQPPPDQPGAEAAIAALDQLAAAVVDLENAFGRADVEYGVGHRIRRGSVDLPTNGAEGFLQALYLTKTTRQGQVGYAESGSSYHLLTRLHPGGVTAVSIKPWGQSDDPGSPHYADLTELFAQGQHKPLWFERAEIEANLESREDLSFAAP